MESIAALFARWSEISSVLMWVVVGGSLVVLLWWWGADDRNRRRRVKDARVRAADDMTHRSDPKLKAVDLSRLDDDFQVLVSDGRSSRVRYCDFCRKSEHSVRTLFSKSGMNICDVCLDSGNAVRDHTAVDPKVIVDIADLTYQLTTTETMDARLRHTLEQKLQSVANHVRKRRLERPGDIIAGGELIRPIGAGNFATVWEARSIRHKGSPRPTIAVKIFDQDKIAMGIMLWRFHRGIRAMRLFSQLGKSAPTTIVRLFEVSDDMLSFSMQYLPGGDLQRLPKKNLNLKRRLEMFLQICDAVSFAHANGVIHRDIKPANIVLDGGGNALLTDFDIADLTFALTQSVYGGGLGTPLFAAPEQLVATSDASHPTCDVFSLGKLLYFMTTHSAPPIGFTETTGHVPAYMSSVPGADLQDAICLAIREKPEDRFQSVAALTARVRPYIQSL